MPTKGWHESYCSPFQCRFLHLTTFRTLYTGHLNSKRSYAGPMPVFCGAGARWAVTVRTLGAIPSSYIRFPAGFETEAQGQFSPGAPAGPPSTAMLPSLKYCDQACAVLQRGVCCCKPFDTPLLETGQSKKR